jgi:hypothetical protein
VEVEVLVMADWEGKGERERGGGKLEWGIERERTYSNGCAELADSSAERKIKAAVCILSLD